MTEQAGAQAGAGDSGAAAGAAAGSEADKGAGAGAEGKGAAGTIIDGGAEGAAAAAKGTAGADAGAAAPDWRARLAGEDKDSLKRLSRFTDEAAFFKSYRALEAKLSSGEFKKALPEGATPEEAAAWRKENGLPEKPEGYVEKIALPKGLVLGEADKPIVSKFAEAALSANVPPAAFNAMVARYYEIQDAQKAAQDDADSEFRQTSEDALRNVWQGPDFRRNLTAMNNFLSTWPEDVKVNLLTARDPSGRKLGDNPALIQHLASLALEMNPAATLVPAGGDLGKNLEARLGELRALMKDRTSEYYKGPTSAKLQSEYRDLLDAEARMKSRAA